MEPKLQLGDPVRFASHVPDSEMWNEDGQYYVVGLVAEKRGTNVWVAREFPPTSEGPTDGFYVDQSDGKHDDVIRDGAAPTDALEAISAENAKMREALEKAQQALAWAARRLPPSHSPIVERDAENAAAALKEPSS